jgi:integrase/recombinase XerD
MSENGLFDDQGNRLYLTGDERAAFLAAARTADRPLKCFCHVLHYSGCRISEALELTPRRVDLAEQSLRVRSLKKRGGKIIYRGVSTIFDFSYCNDGEPE